MWFMTYAISFMFFMRESFVSCKAEPFERSCSRAQTAFAIAFVNFSPFIWKYSSSSVPESLSIGVSL